MNVSPINLVSFPKNINCKNNQSNSRYYLPFDSVSFSGKKDIVQQEYPKNIQEGIAVGKKILKLARSNSLNYETLNNILNENSPVQIYAEDIGNMPSIAKGSFGKPVAHMLPGYTPDFKLAVANIYLGALPKTSKEESDFAANVAHEYTHVLQRAKDENYYDILKYTKNPNEVAVIARTSKSLMDKMCGICQQKLFNSEKEVRMVLNSVLDNKFDIKKSMGEIDFNEVIDSLAPILAIQLNKNPEDMKNAIKGWIIQETQNEKEAYSVTLDILERSKCDQNIKASRNACFFYVYLTLKT